MLLHNYAPDARVRSGSDESQARRKRNTAHNSRRAVDDGREGKGYAIWRVTYR